MLDNPGECGIYPTTEAFKALDALIRAAVEAEREKNRTKALAWAVHYPTDVFPQIDGNDDQYTPREKLIITQAAAQASRHSAAMIAEDIESDDQ